VLPNGKALTQAWAQEGRRGASKEGEAWEAGSKGVPLDRAPDMQVQEGGMEGALSRESIWECQMGKCQGHMPMWEGDQAGRCQEHLSKGVPD